MFKMKIKTVFTVLLVIFVTAGYGNANINKITHSISGLQPYRLMAINVNVDEHNCSMWAAISNYIEDGIIYDHLIGDIHSLKNLSQTVNPDGWGIAYYLNFGDTLAIERGALRAYNDPDYDSVVVQLDISKPKITLAHIRNCGSGCCCHGCETIPNPHPFLRYKNDKNWIFAHNGHVSKSLLYDLIGEEYLEENPPDGSGIPECDPSDTSLIVDSELYFLYLLKHIEKNNWNTFNGVITAITELVYIDASAALNFILSDGYNIWAFRKGASLYYLYDSLSNYCTAATIYPSGQQGDWQLLSNYELVCLSADESPILISPLYIPGDANGDKNVMGNDVIYSVRYLKGLGPPPPDSCWNDSTSNWLYSASDTNGNCSFQGSDITFLVAFFKGHNKAVLWCLQTPPFNLPLPLRHGKDIIIPIIPEK